MIKFKVKFKTWTGDFDAEKQSNGSYKIRRTGYMTIGNVKSLDDGEILALCSSWSSSEQATQVIW